MPITSSAASETLRARNRVVTRREPGSCDSLRITSPPPPPGQVHVEQHHLGPQPQHGVDGVVDVLGLAEHVDGLLDLGAHAAAEHRVVVDDDHAAPGRGGGS